MRYAVGARDDGKMLSAKTWTPKANSDRSLLLEELSSILASPHFSNSKRYPAFLRHVVEKSLDGQAEDLKERTIGVEVFGRHPDYDTNADPVVRVSAGEVRKRIAHYYHAVARESQIQIELPIGSYTPEFKKLVIHLTQVPTTCSVFGYGDRGLSSHAGRVGASVQQGVVAWIGLKIS